MKNALTQTEQKILEMVRALDIIIEQMRSLIPSITYFRELDQWNGLQEYHNELRKDTYTTIYNYLQEKSKEEDVEQSWKKLADTLQSCVSALEEVGLLLEQDKITPDQYEIITKPLNKEITNVCKYTVSKLKEKEKELNDSNPNSNPLAFII